MRKYIAPELAWLMRRSHSVSSLYVYTLFCFGVTAVLSLLDPLIIKWLIDDILPRRELAMIPVAAFGFFLSTCSD